MSDPTPEQIEKLAQDKFPLRHFGMKGWRAAPEGCLCDDCMTTTGRQYAYEAGYADAIDAVRAEKRKPNAKVILRGSDSDCATGVCPNECSHLMWLCDRCSCEGGWGGTEELLTQLAAEHTCPPCLTGDWGTD